MLHSCGGHVVRALHQPHPGQFDEGGGHRGRLHRPAHREGRDQVQPGVSHTVADRLAHPGARLRRQAARHRGDQAEERHIEHRAPGRGHDVLELRVQAGARDQEAQGHEGGEHFADDQPRPV